MMDKTEKTLRPIAACYLGPQMNRENISRELVDSGIQPEFFETGTQLDDLLANDQVFCVFIDLDVSQEKTEPLLSRMKGSHCKWVMMAHGLTVQQSQSMFNNAATDVLPHPVHPITIKSRTRMLLARYLKTNRMPEGTVLPAGISQLDNEKPNSDFSEVSTKDLKHVTGDFTEKPEFHHLRTETKETLPRTETLKGQSALAKEIFIETPTQIPIVSRQPLARAPFGIVPKTQLDFPFVKRSEEYVALKKKMKTKAIYLSQKRKPSPKEWPHFASKDFQKIYTTSQESLNALDLSYKEVFNKLSPLKLILLSLKPHTLSEQLPPGSLFQILTMGLLPSPKDIPLSSELYPQIDLALESTQAIAVNEPSPHKVGEVIKPKIWISGDSEEDATVVVPLYDKNNPFAVVLISFKESIPQFSIPVIEEAIYVLMKTQEESIMADYFARIYRNALF